MGCIEHLEFYDNIMYFGEHRHTSCELLYLHEGETELSCGGETLTVRPGMIYIIPSCVMHENSPVNTNVYKRTLMFFNPWRFCSSWNSDIMQKVIMGFAAQVPIAAEDTFGGEELIDSIKAELERNDALSEAVITALLARLLSGIIRGSGVIDISDGKTDKVVLEVKEYIKQHSAEPIRISEIADKFYISKYHLSHIFKEQTGMSPKQFLTYTRLANAYCMLYSEDTKLSEIADRCGFISPSDMTKKFTEHYGLSPSRFRKELKAKKFDH